jgi:hypothetical protein
MLTPPTTAPEVYLLLRPGISLAAEKLRRGGGIREYGRTALAKFVIQGEKGFPLEKARPQIPFIGHVHAEIPYGVARFEQEPA